jgi:hypothetical protein
MAQDRQTQTLDTPSEWQLNEGKWEYTPLTSVSNEDADPQSMEADESVLDHPVSDRDVDPKSDHDDGSLFDNHDTDAIEEPDGDPENDTDSVIEPESPNDAPPVNTDLSSITKPVSEVFTSGPDHFTGELPVSDTVLGAPIDMSSILTKPIQDDGFAMSFSGIKAPVSEILDMDRFGLDNNAIPTTEASSDIDIQGLTNSDFSATTDSREGDIEDFSDELPLI